MIGRWVKISEQDKHAWLVRMFHILLEFQILRRTLKPSVACANSPHFKEDSTHKYAQKGYKCKNHIKHIQKFKSYFLQAQTEHKSVVGWIPRPEHAMGLWSTKCQTETFWDKRVHLKPVVLFPCVHCKCITTSNRA